MKHGLFAWIGILKGIVRRLCRSRSVIRIALALMVPASGLTGCSTSELIEGYNTPGVFEKFIYAEHPPPDNRRSSDTGQTWAGNDNSLHYQKYPGKEQSKRPTPLRRGITNVSDGYTLNFDNTSLADITQAILKETLNIPYVYDPRVQGTVTLSSGRALSRDELLGSLESILQMNRGALVQEGDRFRIIPLGEAKTGGIGSVSYAEEARMVGPGYGISIFPLRYVSSETMLGMLRSFVAKPGALRTEVRNNVLLIRGTGHERNTLIDVARQFDLDWMQGQSVGIYPLANATPKEAIRQLDRIFQNQNKGLGKNLISFQPMERLNAVMVVTSRTHLLRKAETWVRRLDQINDNEIRTFVYKVENAKAGHLAKVLSDTFGEPSARRSISREAISPGLTVSTISDNTQGDGNGTEALDASTSGDPLRTGAISPRSGDKSAVRIVADEVNNKLVIQASTRLYRDILSVLRKLDQPPLQVLINVTLAEVTLNDNLRYGVQVFLESNSRKAPGVAGFSNDNSLTISPQFPGLNFLYGVQASPKVILDALSNETSVRVVSSPSVVVVNNQTATLQVGDEVPIATRQATSVTDPVAPIVNNIEFRDTGVILKVTPRINSDGLVTMVVEQEISNVVNATTAGATGTLTPTISQRRISSTISVQSGQMVVLGGLISERKDFLKNRVPIWEKIPILGEIPGKTDNASRRTELVVFLLPHVIRDSKDASLITEELRARLRALTPNKRRKYERWPRPAWQTSVYHDDFKTDY